LKYPPARLDSADYNLWLKENPKRIEGGEFLELTCCRGYSEKDDAWNLDARAVSSDILELYSSESLYIMGVHEKFEGFKVYVNIRDDFLFTDKFLLMGHQHHCGPYVEKGIDLGDHPHFHEIKYANRKYSGEYTPRKTHRPSPLLSNGIDSEQFLYAFLKTYFFDHSEDGKIRKIVYKQFQSDFGKFENDSGAQ
jgi:hypothetical protein